MRNGQALTSTTNRRGRLKIAVSSLTAALIVGLPLIAAVGNAQAAAAGVPGAVWEWGHDVNTPQVIAGLPTIRKVAAADTSQLALDDTGAVWAWGAGDLGQLGDGSTTSRTTPAPVPGLADVVDIAAARDKKMAVLRNGTVWTWGGSFDEPLRTRPEQIPGLTSITSVAPAVSNLTTDPSNAHLALLSDGTVVTFGYSTSTSTWQIRPVAGLTDIVAIDQDLSDSGGYHRWALSRDGHLFGWGTDVEGELGDGTGTSRTTPAPVGGLGPVKAFSAGGRHVLALLADGSVWAWGQNIFGQLGDGTITNRPLPQAVPGISGARAVEAGRLHSLVILNDGSMLAWGYNTHGELGHGTGHCGASCSVQYVTTPVPVVGIGGATDVASHADETLAVADMSDNPSSPPSTTPTPSPSPTTPTPPPTSGPQPFATWAFDEPAGTRAVHDTVHGEDGDASTAQQGVPGVRGSAILVEPSTGVDFTAHAAELAPRDAFTFEAWIKPAALTETGALMGWTKGGWQVSLAKGHLRLDVNTDAGQQHVATRAQLDIASWHHVVVTKTDAVVALYIDGRPDTGGVAGPGTIAGQAIVYPTNAKNRHVVLGGPAGVGTTTGYAGSIDEASLYMDAITADAAAQHYSTLARPAQRGPHVGGQDLIVRPIGADATGEECTAGFIAIAASGPMILTANHCRQQAPALRVYEGPAGDAQGIPGAFVSPTLPSCSLGSEYCMADTVSGMHDVLAIKPLPQSTVFPQVEPPLAHKPIAGVTQQRGAAFSINGVVAAGGNGDQAGQAVCLYGVTTGTRCGKIVANKDAVKSCGLTGADKRQALDPSMRFVDVLSQGGDSGGPAVFTTPDGRNLAAGIAIDNIGCSHGMSAYIAASAVQSVLGVQIATLP